MPLILICRKHPKYKVVRKPTKGCDACADLWHLKTEATDPLSRTYWAFEVKEESDGR